MTHIYMIHTSPRAASTASITSSLDATCIICIGVVSVYIQCSCVYYCDTYLLPRRSDSPLELLG
jgi:hypothetical protein